MQSLQLFLGLLIGKLLAKLMELRGSSGTALPGLVVERLFPGFLASSRKSFGKVIVITGTNGKTSTQTLLASSLISLKAGKVLVNSRGANLSRGLVTEVVRQFRVIGVNQFAYTIFEVEEATFPKIAAVLKPDYIIITNFFRDQLDAYGEINRTKEHVTQAVKLNPQARLILNADDPQVLDCVAGLTNQQEYIFVSGAAQRIQYEAVSQKDPDLENDQIQTPSDRKNLIFNPLQQLDSLGWAVNIENTDFEINFPGFHNIYSFAFTYAVVRALDTRLANSPEFVKAIRSAPIPFGRGETIIYQKSDKQNPVQLQLLLVKNPVGFAVLLDMLADSKQPLNLVILINDKIADGRDVSWLWDSPLEKLNLLPLTGQIYLAGSRALDMNLRLKYALAKSNIEINTYASMPKLLEDLSNSGISNYKILATYTAMNSMRDLILQ